MQEIAKSKWDELLGTAAADFDGIGGSPNVNERLDSYAGEMGIDIDILKIQQIKVIFIGSSKVTIEFTCSNIVSSVIEKIEKTEKVEDFLERFNDFTVVLGIS